jgi:hypothetical protein
VTKPGIWFFTISISAAGNGNVPEGKERQLAVGQLARLFNGGTSMDALLRIDNFLPPREGQESKIQMSVGARFEVPIL